MEVNADLHIHTALSPCAAREMTPPAIVAAALERGLAMIAVCDHNSARNAAATQEAAGKSLAVIAGMEIASREEVHVIALFPGAESGCAAGAEVAETLPYMADPMRGYGAQSLMDAAGRVIGTEPRMLASAARFTLNETVRLIHRHGGLAVAAHVNRPAFGVIGQLGVFPADAGFDAVEILASSSADPVVGGLLADRRAAAEAAAAGYGLPELFSSDSHFLAQIGSALTRLELREPTFEELASALRRMAD